LVGCARASYNIPEVNMIQLGTKEISNESNSSTQMEIYPRNRWLKNFNVQALKYLLVLRIQHYCSLGQSMFGEILWSVIHIYFFK